MPPDKRCRQISDAANRAMQCGQGQTAADEIRETSTSADEGNVANESWRGTTTRRRIAAGGRYDRVGDDAADRGPDQVLRASPVVHCCRQPLICRRKRSTRRARARRPLRRATPLSRSAATPRSGRSGSWSTTSGASRPFAAERPHKGGRRRRRRHWAAPRRRRAGGDVA